MALAYDIISLIMEAGLLPHQLIAQLEREEVLFGDHLKSREPADPELVAILTEQLLSSLQSEEDKTNKSQS